MKVQVGGQLEQVGPWPLRVQRSGARDVLGICFVVASMLILGCATRGGTDSSQVNSGSSDDPNFISAPGLSPERVSKLWDIATNKCYDFGYAVANSDKSTRNLVCTTQSGGDTMTLRVRFTESGIFVGLQSSSASWALMGMSLGPKTKEHIEMRAALRAGLGSQAQPRPDPQPGQLQRPPAPTAAPVAGSPTAVSETSQGTVRSGPSSPAASMSVAEMQRLLLNLGYQPGPADGVTGRRTIEALTKFQKDNNLATTGQPDSATVDRLRQQKAEAKTQPPKVVREPAAETPQKPAIETPQKPAPPKVKSATDL